MLFPNLSHLGRAPDPERARALVRGALRYLAVTVLPGGAVIAAMGKEIIGLLYQRPYVPGGAWLSALGPAYAAWTVAYLLAIALSGAGHVRSGLGVLVLGLVVQVAVAIPLTATYGPAGAAWGTFAGMSAALAAGLVVAAARFGAIVPWASVARGALLAAVLAFAARSFPAAGVQVIAKGMLLVGLGLALLFVSGELKRPGRRRDLAGAA